MAVTVTTLGEIRLVASRRRRGGETGSEDTIEFHTERGDLAASCAASTFVGRARFVPLRAGDPAWELGPVDVAMILSLRRLTD